MVTLVLIIHLIVSFILMIIILLQSGSSADLASAFGGMSSQTSMGRHTKGNMLTRVTSVSAVIFMFTSLGLAIMMSKKTKGESVVAGMGETKTTKKVVNKTATQKPVKENKAATKSQEKGFKTVSTSNGKVIKVKKLSPGEVKKMLGEKQRPAKKNNSSKKGSNKK